MKFLVLRWQAEGTQLVLPLRRRRAGVCSAQHSPRLAVAVVVASAERDSVRQTVFSLTAVPSLDGQVGRADNLAGPRDERSVLATPAAPRRLPFRCRPPPQHTCPWHWESRCRARALPVRPLPNCQHAFRTQAAVHVTPEHPVRWPVRGARVEGRPQGYRRGILGSRF